MLDYGGQYSQLIARRVRDCGVFSELLPHHVPLEEVARAQAARDHPLRRTRLGVRATARRRSSAGCSSSASRCWASATACSCSCTTLGGRVEQAEVGEFGRSELRVRRAGRAAGGHAARADLLDVAPRHRLRAAARLHRAGLLDAARRSPRSRTRARGIYGIQFHPEVVHTPYGAGDPHALPDRGLRLRARPGRRRRSSRNRCAGSASRSGDGSVICGLSGGVDSSVAALLVHRAVGDQLTCVFVDHGLMRKDEGEQVVSTFRDTFKVPLVAVDAEQRFLDEAQGRRPSPRPSARRSAPSSSASSRRRPPSSPSRRRAEARASSCRARSTPT